jgi:hypothetical protein
LQSVAGKFINTRQRSANPPLACQRIVNWIPGQELLSSVNIQITESKRFTLRAVSTGREVPAIATTAKQVSTGAWQSSIYIVDGRTLISVTARTMSTTKQPS